ncbi:MAG TPA: NfeD family protein, partial [Roseiflexaceae bacterium]|nr:NfeD family protein [Roseiflexaceae bacterium]
LAGWVVPAAALLATIVAGTSIWLAISNRARPVATGIEALIGRTGVATSDLAPRGTVRVDHEVWSAVAVGEPIGAGEDVQVVHVEGVTLWVQPLQAEMEESHD